VKTETVMIYATFPSQAAAEAIGGDLLERRLAACVNILPAMTSMYVWQGKLTRDSEVSMLIKTRADLADSAIAAATQRHPYANPAFVVLPVVGGAPAFLAWIAAETQPSK